MPRLQPTSLLTVLCLLLAIPAGAAPETGPSPGPPVVKFSADAAEPVIEYGLVHHLLADNDPEPLLRVYGSGRVHVHKPFYMKNTGDYEYT